MKLFLCFLIYLTLTSNLSAEKIDAELFNSLFKQNTEKSLDSLYSILNSNLNVDNYQYIVKYYQNVNNYKSDKIVYSAYSMMGTYYRNIGMPDSAKMIFNQAINYKFSNKNYQVKSYQLLASLLIALKEYKDALDILIPLIDKTEDNSSLRATIYTLVSNVYALNNQLENSIAYLHKAMDIKKKFNNKENIAYLLVNFIGLYAMNGDLDNALKYGEQAIKISKELGDKELLGDCYMNLGYVSFMKQDYHKAIDFYQDAIEIEKETNNSSEDIVGLLTNISQCYINLGETKKSIEILENIYKLDESNYHKLKTTISMVTAHFNLLEEYLKKGDIPNSLKAFEKLDYYTSIKDSIIDVENDKQLDQAVADASAKFENKILEDEKSLAETQRELVETKVQKSKRTIILFVILSILLLAFSVTFFLQKRKQKNLYVMLKQKEEKLEIYFKELFIKNEKLIKTVAIKDKLLSVISHDLQTPILSMNFIAANQRHEPASPEDLKMQNEQFKDLSSELNMLLQDLLKWIKSRNDSISVEKTNVNLFSLVNEVEAIIRESAISRNMKIVNNISPEHQIFADRNMIATVLRNFISNSIKYAYNDTEIHINCKEEDEMLKVEVVDKSPGIPDEKLETIFDGKDINQGLGLKISKEFIKMNDGYVFANSELNIGSTFGFYIEKIDNQNGNKLNELAIEESNF